MDKIVEELSKIIKIGEASEEEIKSLIVIPTDTTKGDYALPCFKFAKALRQSPINIAEKVVNETALPFPITRAEAVNGYVNFFIDRKATAKTVLEKILNEGSGYGSSDEGDGKVICIDYSSINIAKPFHIGHLCTTVLGGSLYRIYKKLGYNAVGINHLGDWGTQFGKLIVAFKKWSSEEELQKKGMALLTSIYVKYHEEAEKNPLLDDEARMWFKKIEDGDKEALRLYDLFKEITLREVKMVYERLDINFDSYNGEAFYNDKMQPVLDKLDEQGLLEESDGAKIVDLSKYDMPPCLLVKADGATLYATRDMAAAFYRKQTYDFYKCLYVVAYQQNLHFKQFFKVLEMMGEPWAKDMVHVAFGMVSLEDGVMSTRKGKVVLLDDVLNKAVQKSKEIILEKTPDLKEYDVVAEQVGVGAVVFFALYNNRIKDMVFGYDKVLSFEGETGPYVQYTNARANSVLEKAGEVDFSKIDYEGLNNDDAFATVRQLQKFPSVLRGAINDYEPCYVARYLVDLCQIFNKFYFSYRINQAEKGVKEGRILLTKCVSTVLVEGLRLLGIKAPQRM